MIFHFKPPPAFPQNSIKGSIYLYEVMFFRVYVNAECVNHQLQFQDIQQQNKPTQGDMEKATSKINQ